MIIFNFSHPLTTTQLQQIAEITGQEIAEVRDIETQFDNQKSFVPQIVELIEKVSLNSADWQTEQILVVPPSYNFGALSLLAELHGRMGYFPAIVRLRPVENKVPTEYEVAEIINLQAVRDKARESRRE